MRTHLKKLTARARAKRKLHHKPKRRLFLRTAATGAAALPAGALLAGLPQTHTSVVGRATRGKFPNVLLTTHEGKRVRFYDDVIRGNKIVVLNMMYTQCPEVCGGTMVNLARVRDLNQHIGMMRAGNDALDRWLACPGMAPAEQLAEEVPWAGMAPAHT